MNTEAANAESRASICFVPRSRFRRARLVTKDMPELDWRTGQKLQISPSSQCKSDFVELQQEKFLILRDALLEAVRWTARDAQVQRETRLPTRRITVMAEVMSVIGIWFFVF